MMSRRRGDSGGGTWLVSGREARLFVVIKVSLKLLLLVGSLSAVEGARAQTPRWSFALLDVDTPSAPIASRICANYQQFFRAPLPQTADGAVSVRGGRRTAFATPSASLQPAYTLRWLGSAIDAFDVCATSRAGSAARGDIVPAHYPNKAHEAMRACSFRGNQSYYAQAEVNMIEASGASAALLALDEGARSELHERSFLFSNFYDPTVTNATPIFYVYRQQLDELNLQPTSGDVKLRFYRPSDPFIDLGVLVMLLLSSGCVLVGGLWHAASVRARGNFDAHAAAVAMEAETPSTTAAAATSSTSATDAAAATDPRDPVVAIADPKLEASNCCHLSEAGEHLVQVIFTLFVIVCVIMFAYYARDIAMQVFDLWIIVFGSLATARCVVGVARLCVEEARWRSFAQLLRVNEARRGTRWWLPAGLYARVRPLYVTLLAASLTLALIWRINMAAPWAYIVLNVLNTCTCVYAIRFSELRSLRLITYLMVALFFYDVFMVFGTRLFTADGCSVMVQMATGTDCRQQRVADYSATWSVPPGVSDSVHIPQLAPILFSIPYLSHPLSHCWNSLIEGQQLHMLLGLGDVVVPGWLAAFAFYLDVRKRHAHYLYGFTTVIGYVCGMVATQISLKLMATAQPALLYLIPFTLVPLICLCTARNTLREAWSGDVQPTAPSAA